MTQMQRAVKERRMGITEIDYQFVTSDPDLVMQALQGCLVIECKLQLMPVCNPTLRYLLYNPKFSSCEYGEQVPVYAGKFTTIYNECGNIVNTQWNWSIKNETPTCKDSSQSDGEG